MSEVFRERLQNDMAIILQWTSDDLEMNLEDLPPLGTGFVFGQGFGSSAENERVIPFQSDEAA